MRRPGRCQICPDAEGLEDIGAADGGGDRAVAVLGHGHAGGGAQNGDGGGNVEGAEVVAPGANDIEYLARLAPVFFDGREDGFFAQGGGEGGDFAGRFAFLRERGQKISLDVRRNFFLGKLFNCQPRLLVTERLRGGQLRNELLDHGAILNHGARGSN